MSINPKIAVMIPCYNEEKSITSVINGFHQSLPTACIYVFDNNSTDTTIKQALTAGAIVRIEKKQGKGNVVSRMFADIDADVYVMVDGDGTYDSSQAHHLVDKLLTGPYDMVNGKRVETAAKNYRPGHRFGNAVLTGLVGLLFGQQITDMLSGYKIFSRRYVKSFPAQPQGFEIETELIVHALQMGMATAEVETQYRDRMEGSVSKLNTWTDGFRILKTIIRLMKNERPFEFFSVIGTIIALVATLFFTPIFINYLQTGFVPRLPTMVLISGLGVCSVLSILTGVLLEAITQSKREVRRLHYLSIPVFEANPKIFVKQKDVNTR